MMNSVGLPSLMGIAPAQTLESSQASVQTGLDKAPAKTTGMAESGQQKGHSIAHFDSLHDAISGADLFAEDLHSVLGAGANTLSVEVPEGVHNLSPISNKSDLTPQISLLGSFEYLSASSEAWTRLATEGSIQGSATEDRLLPRVSSPTISLPGDKSNVLLEAAINRAENGNTLPLKGMQSLLEGMEKTGSEPLRRAEVLPERIWLPSRSNSGTAQLPDAAAAIPASQALPLNDALPAMGPTNGLRPENLALQAGAENRAVKDLPLELPLQAAPKSTQTGSNRAQDLASNQLLAEKVVDSRQPESGSRPPLREVTLEAGWQRQPGLLSSLISRDAIAQSSNLFAHNLSDHSLSNTARAVEGYRNFDKVGQLSADGSKSSEAVATKAALQPSVDQRPTLIRSNPMAVSETIDAQVLKNRGDVTSAGNPTSKAIETSLAVPSQAASFRTPVQAEIKAQTLRRNLSDGVGQSVRISDTAELPEARSSSVVAQTQTQPVNSLAGHIQETLAAEMSGRSSGSGNTLVPTTRQLSEQVAQQIQQHTSAMLAQKLNGRSNLTVQLQPRELGSITIEFEQGRELNVVIHARETVARDLIEGQSMRLRAALEDSGVDLGSLRVALDNRNSGQEAHANRWGAERDHGQDTADHKHSGTGQNTVVASTDDPEEVTRKPHGISVGNRTLDLYI